VLLCPKLLGGILRFLQGGSREARADLGRGALVCREWRVVACADALWKDITTELFPCLTDRVASSGYRAYVVEYGRAVLERRVAVERSDWWLGMRMHFEVWDELDGLRVLSAEGPVAFDQGDDSLFMRPEREGWSRVVAASFSAASRDPGPFRFTSVPDYFRRAHEDGLPAGLHVRVTVRDERNGRQALLWSSGKAQALRVEERGEGCYCIYPLDEFRALHSPSAAPSEVLLGGHFWFCLRAGDGQEGVAEQERVYETGEATRGR
jgi:hypothetical protein